MTTVQPIPTIWEPIVSKILDKMRAIHADIEVLSVGKKYGQLVLFTNHDSDRRIIRLTMEAQRKCAQALD